jgi:uncharacterized protein YvpB
MRILWKGIKVTIGFFLILGLLFASGVFTVLLYAKFTSKESVLLAREASPPMLAPVAAPSAAPSAPKVSVMIDAPIVRQNPELPAGCEVTSLAMLLQYKGINKSKLELAEEMLKDETPIVWNKDGTIAYWGNPNLGFVGDVKRNSKAFGIYHTALFPLLQNYIPSAIDMTNKPFAEFEKQLANNIPIVAWTTIDYMVPDTWVIWDSPLGPIQTTFMEHAVLLVGFDEQSVYVNDPLSGKKNVKIDKAQFVASWEAMGRQGLSYTLEG